MTPEQMREAPDLIRRDDAIKAISRAKNAMLKGDKEGGWVAFMRDELAAIRAIPITPEPVPVRPLTAADLADAFGCFWNAALGEARNQQEGHAVASILAEGFSAVAYRLGEIAALDASPAPASLQDRVKPWMDACFGPEISADRLERGDRLLEEVFELLQSGDYPRERVAALEAYVWSRERGEPHQEVGGVMITLAAYCLAHNLDMHKAGEDELARIWTKVEKIRAKQAAKPTGSALPQAWPPAVDASTAPNPVINADSCQPITVEQAADVDLLFDAYKAMLVLHRVLDTAALVRGAVTASNIADRMVAAHPEFPARTALRQIGGEA